MSIYKQKMPVVLRLSGSLAQSGSIGSGSYACGGYTKVIGHMIASASGAINVDFSSDKGANYDFTTACDIAACTSTSFTFDVVGDTVQVWFDGSVTGDTDEMRGVFMLRPV